MKPLLLFSLLAASLALTSVGAAAQTEPNLDRIGQSGRLVIA